MKLIQQYYDDETYINIGGRTNKSITYKPQDIRDAELDLCIEESQSTPVYRMIMNEFLMQLQQTQQISLDELLQVGAFPFVSRRVETSNTRKRTSSPRDTATNKRRSARRTKWIKQKQIVFYKKIEPLKKPVKKPVKKAANTNDSFYNNL